MTNLHGCHNRPDITPETTYVAQSGWSDTFRNGHGDPCRVPVYVDIPHRMTTDCQYRDSVTDRGCAGCRHARAAA